MATLPRYGVGRVDVATPETPTPSGRNPQAEMLMQAGQVITRTALGFKETMDKRADLAADAQANEKFRALQESVYSWEAEKEKTADPDAHVGQHQEYFKKQVDTLLSDTNDPKVVDKFLKRASGFRVERLQHSFGVQNKAFVDREKADVVAETEKLGKFEYLMDDSTFQKEWKGLTGRMDRSLQAGGMTREDRAVAEQKAKDTIWGTRAYRQALQKQPANDDPFGTATMWEATKSMETGVSDYYAGLSPTRRNEVTSLMREEYSRRLTQVNTLDAEKRRAFNDEVNSMEGVLLANLEQASRGEDFELDGKPGKHSIEDVLQATNKYAAVLGGKVNAIQDNARAYQARRDRVDSASATPEEHNVKALWLNKAFQLEVTDRDILDSPVRADMKDEVLRAYYSARKAPASPEEKERNDEVKQWGRFIKNQLNVQTSAFLRDPRIAGIADRASNEFITNARKNRDVDLPELVSSILKRNSDHLKGALDPGLLHSQLPPRYQDMDEQKVMDDIHTQAINRPAGDFYLVQMRWIKSMREKSGPSKPQGPDKPEEPKSGVMDTIRGYMPGGAGKARVAPPKE